MATTHQSLQMPAANRPVGESRGAKTLRSEPTSEASSLLIVLFYPFSFALTVVGIVLLS